MELRRQQSFITGPGWGNNPAEGRGFKSGELFSISARLGQPDRHTRKCDRFGCGGEDHTHCCRRFTRAAAGDPEPAA
jgi:hypothetical protein